jgi:hypothetical protein
MIRLVEGDLAALQTIRCGENPMKTMMLSVAAALALGVGSAMPGKRGWHRHVCSGQVRNYNALVPMTEWFPAKEAATVGPLFARSKSYSSAAACRLGRGLESRA